MMQIYKNSRDFLEKTLYKTFQSLESVAKYLVSFCKINQKIVQINNTNYKKQTSEIKYKKLE